VDIFGLVEELSLMDFLVFGLPEALLNISSKPLKTRVMSLRAIRYLTVCK
jgi:hypothetical protein